MKKLFFLFVFQMFLIKTSLVQASNSNSEQKIETIGAFRASDFDSEDQSNVRREKKWQVSYSENAFSGSVSEEEAEAFHGSLEEFNLLKRKQDLSLEIDRFQQKTSLLNQIFSCLEDSTNKDSFKGRVFVDIFNYGNEDIRVKLGYVYHAYDVNSGYFKNEEASRCEYASSHDQAQAILKDFVQRHSQEPVASSNSFFTTNSTSPSKVNLKSDSSQKKKARQDLFSTQKKPMLNLRQLTLDELFSRRSVSK